MVRFMAALPTTVYWPTGAGGQDKPLGGRLLIRRLNTSERQARFLPGQTGRGPAGGLSRRGRLALTEEKTAPTCLLQLQSTCVDLFPRSIHLSRNAMFYLPRKTGICSCPFIRKLTASKEDNSFFPPF